MNDTLNNALLIVLVLMGASMVIALIGLLVLVRRIRRMRIPRNAGFFSTLRAVPLALVVLLDLLDFGLDIFSAPIMWVVLDRMGLPNLRNKATIEALIPFTNVLPTFTVCWIAARLFQLGEPFGPFGQGSWAAGALRGEARRYADPEIIDHDTIR
jgi:hypothetical protein